MSRRRGVSHSGGAGAVLSAPQSATWNVTFGRAPGTKLQLALDQSVHNIVAVIEAGQVFTTSTGAITNYQYEFQASSWTGFSSYASCFDQYRVKKIEVYVEPQSATAVLSQVLGKLYTVVDYDDISALSISQIQQYSNVIDAPIQIGRVYRFVPHVAAAVYNGAFTGYANVPSDREWIDCSSSNVQHYGVKMTADQTTVVVGITLRARVWFQFRNQI